MKTTNNNLCCQGMKETNNNISQKNFLPFFWNPVNLLLLAAVPEVELMMQALLRVSTHTESQPSAASLWSSMMICPQGFTSQETQ